MPAGRVGARRRPARAARGDRRRGRRLARARPVPPVELDQRRGRRPVRGPGDRATATPSPEPSEELAVRWLPFDEALAMTADGRITDAMTIMGLQRLALERATGQARQRTRTIDDRAPRPPRLRRSGRPRRQPARRVPRRRRDPRRAAPGRRGRARLLRDRLRRRRGRGRDPDLHARPRAAVRRHPTVGTGWLFRETGAPATTLRPPAGDVPFRHDAERTWIRARPEWVHPILSSSWPAAAVEAPSRPGDGRARRYVWAWIDEPAGVLRSRYFATDVGIREDEATGAAAVVMGGLLRPPADDPPGRRLGDPRPAGRRRHRRDRRPGRAGRDPRVRAGSVGLDASPASARSRGHSGSGRSRRGTLRPWRSGIRRG